MNVSKSRFEISYKLIADEPIMISPHVRSSPQIKGGKLVIQGSSLNSAAYEQYRQRSSRLEQGIEHKAEQTLFGNVSISNILFSDAICTDSQIELQVSVGIDRSSYETDKFYTQEVVPPGTEFIGKVLFGEKPSGIERCIALTAILDIPRWGSHSTRGYGNWSVKILERSSIIVFISYSWENDEHMKWVRNLAEDLIEDDVDVILDQLSPTFDVNAHQEQINVWMKQCVNNCDKVVAILTPEYKRKAEIGDGGVGFEYSCLLAEHGKLSNKIERYIGVLRTGNRYSSLPKYLENRPLLDLSSPPFYEEGLSTLRSILHRY